jgi:hypothetical protein
MTTKYRLGFGYRGQPYIEEVTVVHETEKTITYKGPLGSQAKTVAGKKSWFFSTREEAKTRAIALTTELANAAQENVELAKNL